MTINSQNKVERNGNTKFSRVFVTEDMKKHDFLPVEVNWGRVQVLGEEDFPTSGTGEALVKRYMALLSDFSDDDALILIGDPVLIGLAFSIASNNNDGRVWTMKWNGRYKNWYAVHVNMEF